MAVSEALGEQREVRLSHGAVRYRERGTGPVIVFVHGVLVNGDLWRGVVPALATSHRCITPDLPFGSHSVPLERGADLTPPGIAALLAEFLTALELREVTLVANDAGGAVAQILVTSDPGRIGRLVLTPCDSFWGFPPRYLKPLRWLALLPGMMPVVIRAVWTRPIRALVFWSSVYHRIEPNIMESYVAPMRESALIRRDLGKFFRDTKPRHTVGAARRLHRFQRPTLIVWAGHDLWFPVRNARKLAARLPHCRLEILEHSRTLLPEDQPTELARLITEFLARAGSVIPDRFGRPSARCADDRRPAP